MEDVGRLWPPAAAGALSRAQQLELWRAAVEGRIHLWLAEQILVPGGGWDVALTATARRALAAAAATEVLHRRELLRVTRALAERSVPSLLLKGAAWAYTVYPSPAVRPRVDTDILTSRESVEAAEASLGALGYRPVVESRLDFASPQRHYVWIGPHRMRHAVDLHWRATMPLAFAGALLFHDLWARSVPMRAIPAARTLCQVDALLLACVHRLAHHGDNADLLWLLDIDLLARGLDEPEWQQFTAEADRQRLRGVASICLQRAADAFATPIPPPVRAALDRDPPQSPDSAFLAASLTPLGVLRSDFRWAGGVGARTRLLRDHLFPPVEYMSAHFAVRRRALLPVAYVGRLAVGVPRWIAAYVRSVARGRRD